MQEDRRDRAAITIQSAWRRLCAMRHAMPCGGVDLTARKRSVMRAKLIQRFSVGSKRKGCKTSRSRCRKTSRKTSVRFQCKSKQQSGLTCHFTFSSLFFRSGKFTFTIFLCDSSESKVALATESFRCFFSPFYSILQCVSLKLFSLDSRLFFLSLHSTIELRQNVYFFLKSKQTLAQGHQHPCRGEEKWDPYDS